MNDIKSIVGLFIPFKWNNTDLKRTFSISVGGIGLGWIIVLITIIVKLI